MERLKVKRPYQHFKGNLYYVHDLVQHSETGEILVSYQALYGEYGMFVRPLSMFLEKIDPKREDNITGQSDRFVLFDSARSPLTSHSVYQKGAVEDGRV